MWGGLRSYGCRRLRLRLRGELVWLREEGGRVIVEVLLEDSECCIILVLA